MMPASQRALADPVLTSANSRDAFGAVLALAGEAVVLLLSFSSDVALTMTLALHLVVVAALAIFLFSGRERGSDLSMPAVILLVVMVAGPAGAAVALAALPFYERSGATKGATGILKDWYERLASAGRHAPATEIYDRITSGRVPRLEQPAPLNFLNVIECGTLDQRQKALGMIARHFHPEYTTVLEAALKSPEPVVRVQAAAVVAHVKANLKQRIRRLTTEFKEGFGPAALMRISELQSLQGCALVEKREQVLCRDIARGILERTLATGSDIAAVGSQTDERAAAAIERYFLNTSRYKDLRVLRRVRGILKRGAFRLRRNTARRAA